MTITRRYVIILSASALVLFAVCLFVSYRDWSRVAWGEDGGALWHVLEWTFFEACDAVTWSAPYLIGSTFAVGLTAAFRETGPLALAPVVLMLAVGALVTLSSIANFYEVVSTNDVGPLLAGRGGAWAVVPFLTASLVLSAVLSVVVCVKARRAS